MDIDKQHLIHAAINATEELNRGEKQELIEALNAFVAHEQKLRMQYLGVLNFVAEQAVHFGPTRQDGSNAGDEAREMLESILDDAKRVVPRFRWKRTLDRFDIELSDDEESEDG